MCATMCLNERCVPVNFARFSPCAASTVKEKLYSVHEPVMCDLSCDLVARSCDLSCDLVAWSCDVTCNQ